MRWYDADVSVRVYLADGVERTEDDVELALQGVLDDAEGAFTEHTLAGGRIYRRPLADGISLSVQGIELGELRAD